ncbi:hypothetical protein Syun_031974 [Stephania yunnanensis]|uniref:Uncharacterized protein n=1 Tax=Stephania yunnanensis TaxID=152371 RepID=A0AAP0HE50_9MAGN
MTETGATRRRDRRDGKTERRGEHRDRTAKRRPPGTDRHRNISALRVPLRPTVCAKPPPLRRRRRRAPPLRRRRRWSSPSLVLLFPGPRVSSLFISLVVLHLPGHRPRPASRLLPLHLADSLVVLHRASSLCIAPPPSASPWSLVVLHRGSSLCISPTRWSSCIAPPPSASRLLPLLLPGRWSSPSRAPPSRISPTRWSSRIAPPPLSSHSTVVWSARRSLSLVARPCSAGAIAPDRHKKMGAYDEQMKIFGAGVIDWKLRTDGPIDLDAFELQSVG